MAVYRFQTPSRITVPLSHEHPLFRRVRNTAGVCLVKHADGTWEEFEALPSVYDANADYMFGRTDRSSIPFGRGFAVSAGETPNDREFRSPLRIYRGGHVYAIDNVLKDELVNAVTSEEPGGYDAYITDLSTWEDVWDDIWGDGAFVGKVGDEVLVSGRTPEYEQGN